MVVVGVTGSLGTGKSTVAKMFGELGATVIDADRIAHEVMEPKRLAWREIVKVFGQGILNEDGSVNRRKLGELVFREEEARRRLEAIVHPQVIRAISRALARLRRGRRVKIAVVDVPLLVETRTQEMVDVLVVVTAPDSIQRQRLIARGMVSGEIEPRIMAQGNLSDKVGLADYVVDNAKGLEQTRRQVRRLCHQLAGRKRKQHV